MFDASVHQKPERQMVGFVDDCESHLFIPGEPEIEVIGFDPPLNLVNATAIESTSLGSLVFVPAFQVSLVLDRKSVV